MALIRNRFRDTGSPLRMSGVFGPAANSLPAFNSGATRNFPAGEGAVSGETNRSGLPSGATHPVTWLLPQKAGGLSARYRIFGSSGMGGAGALGLNAGASISSTSTLEAVGNLIVSAAATLQGSGTLSGSVQAALLATASLLGQGNVQGAIGALGLAVASLSGSATATVTIRASGALGASILVGATEALSASGIASEILDNEMVETGLTVRETLRLCLAALAGEISGAPGSTITIRSAIDHKDRIVATVDSNGNRTSISLDAA